MDDNPEIRDSLNVNKSTYHNQRPRERFICFIRGAKWMKINQLNGPSPIHDTSTWLSQSIQSITHVCCACKKISLKVLQDSFRPLRFPVSKLDACANVTTCCSYRIDWILFVKSASSVRLQSYCNVFIFILSLLLVAFVTRTKDG